VTFHKLKSFVQQTVPGEMLASKPQITVMSKSLSEKFVKSDKAF